MSGKIYSSTRAKWVGLWVIGALVFIIGLIIATAGSIQDRSKIFFDGGAISLIGFALIAISALGLLPKTPLR